MSQQNKDTKTSSPAELPVKRKRGRPRKEDPLVQEENISQIHGSDGMKKTQNGGGDPESETDDEMVGQAVSGVLNGSFDAGYFLTVKVGNTDTLLSGVVFEPGLIAPITAANDVAPHVKMHRRKEIPIPVLNLQTQLNSSVQQCKQDNKLPPQLEKQALKVTDQVLPSELHSGISPAFENQCTPVMVSLTNNMPKNDTSLKIGGHGNPLQTLNCGQENQSASVARFDSTKTVKQDGTLQEFGVAIQSEGPKIDVGDFKNSISGPSSGPYDSMLSGNETINQVPQVVDQPKNYVTDLNEFISCEVKSPNHELHQAPVVADCNFMPPEVISMQIDIPMERYASPKNNTQQDIDSELALKISSGVDTSQLNGRPVGDAADISEGSFQSEVKTSQSVMNFEGAPILDELKLAAEGSDLPRVIVPQISMSAGPAIAMDCDDEDAIPPTQA